MPTRSASPAGTSLRKSRPAPPPGPGDRPGVSRANAPASASSQLLNSASSATRLPSSRSGPGARRPCRARACDRSPRCRRRSAARPAASARPRCAGMPARHPGDAPWRDPGRRGDARLVQPVEPGGNALHDVVMRAFFASRSRFARAWSSTRSRRREAGCRHAPATGLPGSRPPDGRGAESPRARRRQAYSRERPGFLPGQGCHTDAAGPSNPAHHPLPRYWSLAARAHDGWVDASADSSARSIAVDRSRHCCVPP